MNAYVALAYGVVLAVLLAYISVLCLLSMRSCGQDEIKDIDHKG